MERNGNNFFFIFLNHNLYFHLLLGDGASLISPITGHRGPAACFSVRYRIPDLEKQRTPVLFSCDKLSSQPRCAKEANGVPTPSRAQLCSDVSLSLLGLRLSRSFCLPPVDWHVLSALGFSLQRPPPPISLPLLTVDSVTVGTRYLVCYCRALDGFKAVSLLLSRWQANPLNTTVV